MVKLTKTSDQPVIFNWDNVAYVTDTVDSFGNVYCEVCLVDGRCIQVKEDLDEIQSQLN
jgi:uncharacterized protein YlzI (FlbEa/FlbD family)